MAELDRIFFELADQISAAYSEVRMTRKSDRREFVVHLENLKTMAFLQARAVECGSTDIRAIMTVFNLMRQIDLAVHSPDLILGRNKAKKDSKTGYLRKDGDHQEWRDAYQAARAELKALGVKRNKTKAAEAVIERLKLTVTPAHVLRAVSRKP